LLKWPIIASALTLISFFLFFIFNPRFFIVKLYKYHIGLTQIQ
jgi:hypothetical protein